jgi:Integrase core domain
MRLHPQYAQALGMSLGWVKKWKKRLQEADAKDEQVLHSRSRAPEHPPERILQMRDEPPEGLQRTPGPKAILYYLPHDPDLQGERLPRSSRTIHRILQQAGRIVHRLPHLQEELSRPAPVSQWQLDFNGFVEWYHRTHQEECLAVQRPGTLQEVREATEQFQQHYNWSRPHQWRSIGNRPPRVAFPTLPALPAVPDLVDPDCWLRVNDGLHLVRLVRRDGTVRVDLKSYYVGRSLAGQHVALHSSAAKRALLVVHGHQVIKTLPLKGLWGKALRFECSCSS